MWEKLRDNLGFAIAVASLVLTVAFGLNVDKVFDVSRPYFLVPYGLIVFALGCAAGWWFRNAQKKRDARIERADREHEEKMRREREEREAAEEAEDERRAHEELLDAMAARFKRFDVEAKKLACAIYDEGEIVAHMSLDNAYGSWAYEAKMITDYETMPDRAYRYTLKPDVREMIDDHPELIAEVRESMKEGQQG